MKRRGIATGIAIGFICLAAVISSSLSFTSSGTSRVVVHTLADRACEDLCLSALAEAMAVAGDAVATQDSVAGVPLADALRRKWPFEKLTVPTPAAIALGHDVYPGLKLEGVTLEAGTRSAPGSEDPLTGTVRLSVRASGRVAGAWAQLTLAQELPFRVRCTAHTQSGHRGTYMRFHWGEAFLAAHPLITEVKP